MHVLHVTPYFPPTWAYGGIPRIVDGLSRALAAAGTQVSVLTTDAFSASARSGRPPRWTHHGVAVRTLPNLSNRLAYRHQLFTPLARSGTFEGLEDVDVVHLHGHRHLLNNLAARWAQRRGIPYVMTSNGTLLRHERKVGVKLLWDALIAGSIPRNAARLVAVSRADVAMHLQAGLPAERIVHIPNGLDLGEFDPLPPRGRFRTRHGLGQGPLVAYLGQISPRKGVDHLVAAFAKNPPNNATLIIAGNDMGGRAAAEAQQAPGDQVRFVGLLEGRARLELLADADVLVYASTAEVFGLVPFEGLLCGAPVVVGDDCGCGELIAEAGAGLLVQHGDVAGLRARINTLLHDRVAAQAMVHRGRRYIRDRLGFDQIARQHATMYAELSA
ncbi:MAG: glycosyltransferase involved in cell wall biosynthesis [Myxococcota bacterium]|jgi:glycosyltransferase involved in cell wall biosynthesis